MTCVIDRGVLRVVDNQVDQTTGTVKLKAEFPNTNLQLWPGQFVNIRLLIDTLKQVTVIPTGAVQRGPNGTFVYVIKDDETGGGEADRGPETGRDANGRKERCGAERARGHYRIRPPHRRQQSFDRQRQRAGSRRKARGHATDSKSSGAAATIRGRTRSNERIVPIYSPADRHFSARRRGDAGRIPGLLVAAGFRPASSRFPDHSGHNAIARRQRGTIAALVTAPLERQFGQIPSLQTMTSSSSFGISQVTLQFDLNRDIDAAAQDVQSAINAAASTLPRNLPYPPLYSKVNPADAPIITLALTSQAIDLRTLSDMADTIMAPRLSEVTGVGHVSVQGGIRPAIRIQADLSRLAAYGHGAGRSAHGYRRRQCRRTERRARRRTSVLHHRRQ